jgi:hypothetical protein
VFLFASALPAFSGTKEDVLDVFAVIAAALSDGSGARAISSFDKAIPEYSRLREYLYVLAEGWQTSCSIEVVEFEEAQGVARLKLRWLLRISAAGGTGRMTDREQDVSAKVERRGKAWKITAFDPVEFFRPPR